VRISRDGDRPARDGEERRRRALRDQRRPGEQDDPESGPGHIDVIV
jgi:hypothetical protein